MRAFGFAFLEAEFGPVSAGGFLCGGGQVSV